MEPSLISEIRRFSSTVA